MSEMTAEIQTLQNGRFEVCSILGAGGFGITYRCVDKRRQKVCAIKEYMPEAIASRDSRTGAIVPQPDRKKAFLHGKNRFLEEAEILMQMNQIPYVVHVWEAFEENHTAYYVMEFLEGTTLKQLMRAMGGKLPYTAALEAVEKAGSALDTIHRQAGIFHRDISPENIMVMPDGTVKIIDFGSAKAMAVKENQQFSVVLKPGFAPPEQYASNLSQGSFTDVYALAGTFYYAASGKMIPVAPDRLMGVTYERLDQLVPECGEAAADAVDRALNLDAKFRTQTMSEFIQGITQGRRTIPVRRETTVTENKTAVPESIAARIQKAEAEEAAHTEADTMTVAVSPAVLEEEDLPTVALPREPQAWLEVVAGACAGTRFPVEPNRTITVGRVAKKSQIVLSGHPEISGLHFRLLYQPEKQGFYVIDESINGLYYQGIRLEKGKKYKVLPGDCLGVGSMQCMITVGVKQDD